MAALLRSLLTVILLIAAGFAAVSYMLSGSQKPPEAVQEVLLPDPIAFQEYKESRKMMGAYVSLHCYFREGQDIGEAVSRCWKRIEAIQTSMNNYSDKSEISRLNREGVKGTRIAPDLYGLIARSVMLSRFTGGAFDVTVLPLVELWKKAASDNRMPKPELVKKLKEVAGFERILLEDEGRIRLEGRDVKIDVGGIAKGYAADQAAMILASEGIGNFMVDAGGDIFCAGRQEGHLPWRVGIQDPLDPNNLSGELSLENMAVTTSGNYSRFYKIGDREFSHIIDPRTGYPQETVVSATVIAPSTEQADALSTALSVLGGKEGIALIEQIQGVEALVIEKHPDRTDRFPSSGFSNYTNK